MSAWKPSPHYAKIVEANRLYYARTAATYDATETCVVDADAQRELESDLDRVLAALARPPTTIRALDACGGSGNVSLKLLRRGVPTTTCDVSTDLLDLFRARCVAEQLDPEIVVSEIGAFLADKPGEFDVIVFSSALHHLEDVHGVLALAARSLRPGGLLFTTHDPAAHRVRVGRLVTWLDYVAFKLLQHPEDVVSAIGRRTTRLWRGQTSRRTAEVSDATLGFLAEYHVEHGLDDFDLVARLRAEGLTTLWHERSAGARHRPARWLLSALGSATSFKSLLRKSPVLDPTRDA